MAKIKSKRCSTGHGTGHLMPMSLHDQLRPTAKIKKLFRHLKKVALHKREELKKGEENAPSES